VKSYCYLGHVWHAEFAHSLCPFCHAPALGSVRLKDIDRVMAGIVYGLERSVLLHGDWRNYGLGRMLWVIGREALEVLRALARGDLHGPHGVVAELRDVAICCIKAVMVLKRDRGLGTRDRGNRRGGRRENGTDCFDGRVVRVRRGEVSARDGSGEMH